ncbi:MAG: hypothetical protein K6T33_09200 [Thermomonas hydrothermalis]|uniref:hypothetical protein n=1 Tax=Thermomonas hydrothermalis TaxID=213588 RepID=UPI0023542FAC|nr:hypothetical protein [Thermomonas hydrothermalis]MCL6619950.1 hypothetical protein [Thermomonas hydrothermalis]
MTQPAVGQIVYGMQTVQQLSIHVEAPGHQATRELPPDALAAAVRALDRAIERLRLRVALPPLAVCTAAGTLAVLLAQSGLGYGGRLWLFVALWLICASQAWWWAGGWWMRQRDALRAARQQRVGLLALVQPALDTGPMGGRFRRQTLI